MFSNCNKCTLSSSNTIKKCGGIKIIDRIKAEASGCNYFVHANDDSQFLLKVYSNKSIHDLQYDCTINHKISHAKVKIPKILEIGFLDDSSLFELFEWIPGSSLNELLSTLTKEQQYKKGLNAGRILKSIHLLRLDGVESNTKKALHERIEAALALVDYRKRNKQQLYKAEVFKKYLLSNPVIYDEQKKSLLHGDYHTGNIINDFQENLWVIDWLYGHVGDPTEDFVRIFVSSDCYPDFAKGQVHGYFDGNPPLNFWHKLKIYTAIQQLEILSYSLGKLPNGQTFQEHQHNLAYIQYNGMKSIIPQFYK